MEVINEKAINKFKTVTSYDILSLMVSFSDFVERDYPNIVNFYLGKISANIFSFKRLENLKEEITKVFELISYHGSSLADYDQWILLEKLEDIKSKIDLMSNISRFLRSSILDGSYKETPQVDYITKQKDNFEIISNSILLSEDPSNTWVNIALDNKIREEDYTLKGGLEIKLNLKYNKSINLSSVVDNLNQENIYGKDISKKFEFIDDDLKSLSPDETIDQSIEILSQLRKNQNPLHPLDGIDSRLAMGNLSSLNFPSLLRQLHQTFQKDDTIKEIIIRDIKQENEVTYIEYDIRTILGDLKSSSLFI